MEILAFADFHGNQDAYRKANEIIAKVTPRLVLVVGDIFNRDSNEAKARLTEFARKGAPVYFVPGNMDGAELSNWDGVENVHQLHGRCVYAEGVALIGLGGAPHGPFKTVFEYSENEGAQLLEQASKEYHGGKLILLSHCPPKDTKLDIVPSGDHAGSQAVRSFVEKKQPVLVLSGHVHESQGIDMIGSTTLVNVGSAQNHNYAHVTLEDEVRVRFAKFP